MKSPLIACALLAIASGASAAPPVDLAKFPDTAASDPKANALMVGTPPPPDKLVRWADGSHFRFPNTRWSFSHMREVMPTADVWRGSGKPSHFARAEQKLDTVAYTDMDGIARTWGEALTLPPSRSSAERPAFPCPAPTSSCSTMPVRRSNSARPVKYAPRARR